MNIAFIMIFYSECKTTFLCVLNYFRNRDNEHNVGRHNVSIDLINTVESVFYLKINRGSSSVVLECNLFSI